MPPWPKDKLLQHGPELPMAERVRRYQHNIRTIRASGCAVPRSAYVDTLDPVAIEMWFLDSAERWHRLRAAVQALAALPPDSDAAEPPTVSTKCSQGRGAGPSPG